MPQVTSLITYVGGKRLKPSALMVRAWISAVLNLIMPPTGNFSKRPLIQALNLPPLLREGISTQVEHEIFPLS